MDLAERPLEVHTRIIQTAEPWCRAHFRQDTVQIREVCEIPTPYPGGRCGYRVIVTMPDYPHGEHIDVVVAPDDTIAGVRIPRRRAPRRRIG